MHQSNLTIFADGAYSSLRNQGGWAFYIPKDNILKYNGLVNTTNNRMEILACIKVFAYLINNNIKDDITLYTDSMYVIGTATKNWQQKKNKDLWEVFFKLIPENITFQHVKGHSGDENNNKVDTWAKFGSQLDGCEIDLGYEKEL